MATFSIITILLALRFFLTVSGAPAPLPVPADAATSDGSNYWLSTVSSCHPYCLHQNQILTSSASTTRCCRVW